MAIDPRIQLGATGMRAGVDAKDIDQGLRAYMLRVYNYMGSALALSGAVAIFAAGNDAIMAAVFGSPLQWVVMLAPLGLVMFLGSRINKMSASAAQTTFWIFAALMGLSLSFIFLVYTPVSITRVFFITAGTFGAMSLYGYTTKRDLTGVGSFMMMGLIGVIIASVVNFFLQSSALQFGISVIGVLVFVGLTAYDTQKIRQMYQASDGSETMSKKAIMGALTLYLDFINLFLMMLHLFGNRD
jgi:FtsH-binding integral membrane protein